MEAEEITTMAPRVLPEANIIVKTDVIASSFLFGFAKLSFSADKSKLFFCFFVSVVSGCSQKPHARLGRREK